MLLMAHTPQGERSIFGTSHNLGYPSGFGYAARPPAGLKRPCDMDSLKMAISQAIPGTGQVKRAITDATFQPRAPAFTSLIQTCAKFRQVQKAIEIFDTMATSEAIDVKPNTVHYSALISACATAGKWQEALDVFESMKQAAFTDPNCIPNTITYSSLISACAAGSRLDKALQVYDEMQEAGLQPDHITYSTLISAYEKAGELAEALALLDKLHEAGGAASADTYVKIMQYLAGKQLWNRALEVFLELQAAGVTLGQPLCLALLSVFEACGQSQQAQDVLTAASNESIPLNVELYNAVLRCCILEQHGERAIEIWEEMQAIGIMPNAASAEALLQSCQDCQHLSHKVNSMTAPFQAVLAAAQLMPRTAPLQGMANASTTDVPDTLPSADIMHRWQASPPGSHNMAASLSAQVDQSSGAGLQATAPPPGQLGGALKLSPLAALSSSRLADETGHLASGLKSGPMAAGSGSGPPTGAPPTPDLHSEGSDVSPSHAEEASAHQL